MVDNFQDENSSHQSSAMTASLTAHAASPHVSAPPRSHHRVSRDDAIARARGLIPLLRAHAQECEDLRRVSPAVMAALHETGLLRIHQPRRWGGMELDFTASFDICEILGQGDASVGWVYANLSSHHRQLALWPLQAQEEVLGDNPDAGIASGVAYVQGKARPLADGVRLSGQWGFSSGIRESQWAMLACVQRDGETVQDWCFCLVPQSDYEIVDDWHTFGLRGSGSCTVRCKDILVPGHRVLSMKAEGHAGFPGLETHQNPLFRVSTSALSGNNIAAVLIGNAQSAVDHTIEAVKARSTSYAAAPMRDIVSVQHRVGLAAGRIDAARAWLRGDCQESESITRERGSLSLEQRLRYRRNTALASKWVAEAVASLQELAGANGIYEKHIIQRLFRDACAASVHVALNAEIQLAPWALHALGGTVRQPTV